MPIYEYQCQKCGHLLEAFQSMSEAALTDCPACMKPGVLQRLMSAAGFQLKGTGWYATDFRNSGKPAAPARQEGADKKPEVPAGSSPSPAESSPAGSQAAGSSDTTKKD